jgi:hypothetical protein
MKVAMMPETGVRLNARDDVHDAPTSVLTEFDGTRRECEQRVVAPAADISTGVEMSAALTNENLACIDYLTAETLHTKTLGIGVTSVTRA